LRRSIEVLVADKRWTQHPRVVKQVARAASLARARAPARSENGAITILLASDSRLRALNAHFRGKDTATNVLAFPASRQRDLYIGDVAIAYGVAMREARESKKPLEAHAAHLAVHGVLHLLGFDHETAKQAKTMEAIEISVLSAMRIPDPYRSRAERA